MIQRLAALNLIYQWRVLWGLLVAPHKLEPANSPFDERMLKRTAAGLVSTLTWLPLLIPVIAWLAQSRFAYDPSGSLISIALVVIGWLVCALLGGATSNWWAMAAVFVTAAAVAAVLLFQITLEVGFSRWHGLASVTLLVAALGVSAGTAFGIAYKLKIGLEGIFPVVLATAIAFTFLFWLSILAAYGIALALVGVLTYKTISARPSTQLKIGGLSILVALAVGYAAISWLYFFGGWDVIIGSL